MFVDTLEHIYTLTEPDLSWEFNDIAVWRDGETQKLYAGHDAGCSCPTPFEYVNYLSDLTEIRSLADLTAFVDEHNGEKWDKSRPYPQRDIDALLEAVAKVLPS